MTIHYSIGLSKIRTTSSVLDSILLVNASTTSSHRCALITSNRLHCHATLPENDAAVVRMPSPRGRPIVHCDVYRKMSPACSPPGPAFVTTAF
mmetsp:Transcript_53357/g.62319  ORF Transcript_53357/g.62319 Transcript_53357/m.62319 type:complete len:93 (+) Transcript_53357:457-735(+)